MAKYVTYIDGRWVDNSGLAVMEYWDGIEWIDTNTLPIPKKGGEKSMQERIAIKCSTKAEWYAVQDKALEAGMHWSSSGKSYNKNDYQSSITIGLVSDDLSVLTCSTDSYYKDHKYTIISAEEYLKEGEKELPTLTKKETTMHKAIKKIYGDNTGTELLLISKYFGHVIEDLSDNSFTVELWLTQHKDAYLKEAQRLEAIDKQKEEDATMNK